MSSFPVTREIAKRSILLIPRIPSTFAPSVIMPVFLTLSFAGAFSGIVLLPGFPAETSLDWYIPMTTIQGGAFAGVTTGMGVARDLESGFYDRILLSPAPALALVGGPLLAGVLRAMIPLTLLLTLALVGGAHFRDGVWSIVPLAVAAFGVALMGAAWSVALALKFKTMQAAPLMQTGVFVLMFLSTAQMPMEYLTGWLQQVARYNPMTYVLQLGRQGFLEGISWAHTWPGLLALAGMILVLGTFALRAMKRIDA
jgi:ABC-2 type transport system permease protein